MKIELTLKIEDKAFGGTVTIADWDKAPNKTVAENALRRWLDNLYKKAVEDAVKEAINV